jgi:hypothetical protein
VSIKGEHSPEVMLKRMNDQCNSFRDRALAAEGKLRKIKKLADKWKTTRTYFAAYHFCAEAIDKVLGEK